MRAIADTTTLLEKVPNTETNAISRLRHLSPKKSAHSSFSLCMFRTPSLRLPGVGTGLLSSAREEVKPMTRHLSGRASLGLLLTILALAVVLGGTLARADDLNLGGTFNSFNFYNNGVLTAEGGGSLVTSSLTSVTLGFVYCVDINDNITVPGDYNNTIVTNNGNVNGAMVNNAGQVAWLLDNYAVGAEGNANATDQIALQAAIWHVIYGANYYLDPSQTVRIRCTWLTWPRLAQIPLLSPIIIGSVL
jgi:Thioester domain